MDQALGKGKFFFFFFPSSLDQVEGIRASIREQSESEEEAERIFERDDDIKPLLREMREVMKIRRHAIEDE
jgi:hypothetical protein